MNILDKKNDLDSKLEIICSMKSYQKMDISKGNICSDNMATSLYRTIRTICGCHGNNREDLLMFIISVTNDALDFATEYYSSENSVDKDMAEEMIKHLTNVISTINIHITATYSSDQAFVARLRSSSSNISARLNYIVRMPNDISKSKIINNARNRSDSNSDMIPSSI